MANTPSTYSEGSIRVLKGLEPVKQRPGMYTRTDNPLHIIQEVLDNAADEALAGHGKKIKVTLHADGSVSVEDDGRGIPFGLHPEENAPVVELVFTRLHAGGKFDKGKGGAYSFSGGLHGVGVSVTNALSTRLEVTSFREGQVARLAFGGGDVTEPLQVAPRGEGDRKQGTTVRAWPDAKYFDSAALPIGELTHLLRSKAVLMPGVQVTLVNEKTKDAQLLALLGRTEAGLQQNERAEQLLEKALKFEANNADYQHWYATVSCNLAGSASMFSALGYAKRCKKAYETALELAPENPRSYIALGSFLAQAPGIAGGGVDRRRGHSRCGHRLVHRLGLRPLPHGQRLGADDAGDLVAIL